MNNVRAIEDLDKDKGGQYFMFKEGIQPATEDPQNANGMRYRVEFPATQPGDARIAKVVSAWEDLVRLAASSTRAASVAGALAR